MTGDGGRCRRGWIGLWEPLVSLEPLAEGVAAGNERSYQGAEAEWPGPFGGNGSGLGALRNSGIAGSYKHGGDDRGHEAVSFGWTASGAVGGGVRERGSPD